MYKQTAKLILYRNNDNNSILYRLSSIFKAFEQGTENDEEMITQIYEQIHRLLDLSTTHGFDTNLWHNYLTYELITNENPFSIICENIGGQEGSVNHFAVNDFKIFYQLFHYDFSKIEDALGIDCFTTINNYQSLPKKDRNIYKNISEKVQSLSLKLGQAKDEMEVYTFVTDFYKQYGVGKFGLNKVFQTRNIGHLVEIYPIENEGHVVLDDLIGYEIQKKKLIDNTEAFVNGRSANNCLLFGDSGTGKSTCIKAIINEYYSQGLRMIEIYKHQMKDLNAVISQIKNRNYRYIIYMDDLSFEEFETEYKFLKAVIEGGVETKPDNVLIYATSNRRHLIRETWGDRSDMTKDELHHSDTMQEKLSLATRFGVSINFSKPTQKEYFEIVTSLAKRYDSITLSDEELCLEANRWELSHGGISGRTAQQFINYLAGKQVE